MECPFCHPDNVVLEAGPWVALRDRYPVSEGHLLIVPRRHVTHMSGLDGDELATLGAFIGTCVSHVETITGCDGVNVGINMGGAAGQTVPHLHIHVIPRSYGDVDEPRGGVRGVIPSKRDYGPRVDNESERINI